MALDTTPLPMDRTTDVARRQSERSSGLLIAAGCSLLLWAVLAQAARLAAAALF